MEDKKYLDEAVNVLVDVSDNALDILVGNKILEAIPGVRMAVTFIKAGKGYAEERLKRRLICFLDECCGMSKLEIEQFAQKYVRNQKKAGYRLLDGLYNLESDDKATLIGKIYCHCILNNISLNTFYRLMKIVDACYYEDLVLMNKIEDVEFINDGKIAPKEIVDSLFYHGMLKNIGYDGGGFKDDEPGGTMYHVNFYGKIIRDVLRK